MANIFGNLELKFSSMGGGLYIDSGFSSLNLTIFNISMFNSRVRQAGGCIYLISSNKK
jgi:glucokinase